MAPGRVDTTADHRWDRAEGDRKQYERRWPRPLGRRPPRYPSRWLRPDTGSAASCHLGGAYPKPAMWQRRPDPPHHRRAGQAQDRQRYRRRRRSTSPGPPGGIS